MTKSSKFLLLIGAAIALLILGIGLAYVFLLAPEPMSASHAFLWLLPVFSLLLIVPYWLLKMVMHAAHASNPEEKELELKDIPKDEEQLRGL